MISRYDLSVANLLVELLSDISSRYWPPGQPYAIFQQCPDCGSVETFISPKEVPLSKDVYQMIYYCWNCGVTIKRTSVIERDYSNSHKSITSYKLLMDVREELE